MKEAWKPIIGYEDCYEISNYGNLKSIDRMIGHYSGYKRKWKGRLLKPANCKRTGYLSYPLSKSGQSKTFRIHELVGKHFLERGELDQCLNHKDGNKHNNHYSNLEWTTFKKNSKHAIENGLLIHRTILDKQEIRSVYNSTLPIKELAKIFGISTETVKRIKNKSLKCYYYL